MGISYRFYCFCELWNTPGIHRWTPSRQLTTLWHSQAIRLAQIIDEKQEALNGQTFSEAINKEVVGFGQELNSIETQTLDQGVVVRMLEEHRTSIAGVSIDEEMANLLVFQRAFQANAKLITLLDTLVETSLGMIK